jgi:predicted unusual protein kinase regulating ubiquinone biosynthesis (AarF/ABC1/UbiB family)
MSAAHRLHRCATVLEHMLFISTAEGIALRVDPSYSIVQECFPYLARRLLQDNDPRIQVHLKI